ncbi:MAG: DUF554 domain-containing protein [Clostridiales bacterium]|jgi:uncharacterized membrane protein YqgA involved in biofilm formation|nr:DUF554 domain-containing protein [Clostridiales bacterium]
MLGTVVNALAVAAGGIAGSLIKGGLPERFRVIVTQAVGLSVLLIGLSTAVKNLLDPAAEPVLFIISLVLGGAAGELLGIEAALERLGELLRRKFSKNDEGFARGFVSASMLFCVGTMAIIGSIQSGAKSDDTVLFAKSALDGVSAVIFASSMGPGVVFAAVPVFVYQGGITLLARFAAPYATPDLLREVSIAGGALIAALGLNTLGITRIKAGNLLPAVFVPVLYYLIIKR